MKPSDLIADESKWCPGAIAMTADGRQTSYGDPMAVRYCLYGAVLMCGEDAYKFYRWCDEHEGLCHSIGHWNDTHTHAEVVAALKACGL